MNKHWTRRMLALAMALVMAVFTTAGLAEEVTGVSDDLPSIRFTGETFGVTEAEVERHVYPYVKDFDKGEYERSEVALYYVDGGDIPYVALSEYMDLLTDLLVNGIEREGIAYTTQKLYDHTYMVKRTDRDSLLLVDTEANNLSFTDFNGFTQKADVTGSATMADLSDPPEVDLGTFFEEVMKLTSE